MWQVCASRPAKRTLRFLGGVSLRVAIGSTTNADLALTTMPSEYKLNPKFNPDWRGGRFEPNPIPIFIEVAEPEPALSKARALFYAVFGSLAANALIVLVISGLGITLVWGAWLCQAFVSLFR